MSFTVLLCTVWFLGAITSALGDRIGCTTGLGVDGFLCDNGECMLQQWFCDGDEDCQDGSDEQLCGTTYTPPVSMQQETEVCQNNLERCSFKYPMEVIPPPPLNGKDINDFDIAMNASHVEAFCRYLDGFFECMGEISELCYQYQEITLVYKAINTTVCSDNFVKEYMKTAMTGLNPWWVMSMVYDQLTGNASDSTENKRASICGKLTWLVKFDMHSGRYWWWNFRDGIRRTDDRNLFDVPMQTYARLMRPLDVKYGDLRLSECNRGADLGYRNVYKDYKEIYEILSDKYGI